MKQNNIERGYEFARDRYAEPGVDTQQALDALCGVCVSMHCWQGDDVTGFESTDAELERAPNAAARAGSISRPQAADTVSRLRAAIDAVAEEARAAP